MISFVYALVLTIAIETSVLFLVVRFVFREKIGNKTLVLAGIFPSLITLPFVWFFFPYVLAYPASLALSEIFAFVLEAFLISYVLGIGLKKSFAASFLCNLFSFLAGLAVI